MIAFDFAIGLFIGILISGVINSLVYLPSLLPEFRWFRKWKGGNWYCVTKEKTRRNKKVWVYFWKPFLPQNEYTNVVKMEGYGNYKRNWTNH